MAKKKIKNKKILKKSSKKTKKIEVKKTKVVKKMKKEDVKQNSIEKGLIKLEKPVKEIKENEEKPPMGNLNISQISEEIKKEQIYKQRKPVKELSEKILPKNKILDLSEIAKEIMAEKKKGGMGMKPTKKDKPKREVIHTGIQGFDELLETGIPKGNTILVAGGAGSGKTIMCLEVLANKCKEGKKGLCMSFEEREERLIEHMDDFGWGPKELIKKGKLKITRMNPFDITRNVDALLAKEKGELLIDIDPIIIPKDFKPDFVVLDSLTAIASAFTGREENYRIYIEQLFRFFEKMNATVFLITETEQIPKIYSKTGVEEFLADGVVVLYNLKHGNIRENAIEILKLRGAKHLKKIVAMEVGDEGIAVYPEQEVFENLDE